MGDGVSFVSVLALRPQRIQDVCRGRCLLWSRFSILAPGRRGSHRGSEHANESLIARPRTCAGDSPFYRWTWSHAPWRCGALGPSKSALNGLVIERVGVAQDYEHGSITSGHSIPPLGRPMARRYDKVCAQPGRAATLCSSERSTAPARRPLLCAERQPAERPPQASNEFSSGMNSDLFKYASKLIYHCSH